MTHGVPRPCLFERADNRAHGGAYGDHHYGSEAGHDESDCSCGKGTRRESSEPVPLRNDREWNRPQGPDRSRVRYQRPDDRNDDGEARHDRGKGHLGRIQRTTTSDRRQVAGHKKILPATQADHTAQSALTGRGSDRGMS